jgi:hypothetical protein
MRPIAAFTPPLDGSRKPSTRISPLSASAPNPSCPLPVAAKRTRLLLGSYRKGEAEDLEVYTMAIASVLSDYPESVALRVTDPRTGIAGRVQWLPTAFEVREACEREMPPIPAAQRRDAQRQITRQIIDGRERNRVSQEAWRTLRQDIAARDIEFRVGVE